MNKFKRIALIGVRATNKQSNDSTISRLLETAFARNLVEDEIADVGEFSDLPHCALDHIGQKVELAIVVGGDGSLLGAALSLNLIRQFWVIVEIWVFSQIFDHRKRLTRLAGHTGSIREREERLNAVEVIREDQIIARATALNDVVLHKGQSARMLGFDLFIDGQFVYSSRSDGLIVSTPTG